MTLVAEELARRASLDYVKAQAKEAVVVQSHHAMDAIRRRQGVLLTIGGALSAYLILRHGRAKRIGVVIARASRNSARSAKRSAVAVKAGTRAVARSALQAQQTRETAIERWLGEAIVVTAAFAAVLAAVPASVRK